MEVGCVHRQPVAHHHGRFPSYQRVVSTEKQAGLASFAGPGHWNDPDMLEVGVEGGHVLGRGWLPKTSLNRPESSLHFSMWAMLPRRSSSGSTRERPRRPRGRRGSFLCSLTAGSLT